MREGLYGRPSDCILGPHDWTRWGPYVPIQRRVLPPFVPSPEAKPKPQPIEAFRERRCRRCGVLQTEDYYGENRRIAEDPWGIEAKRDRVERRRA